MSHLFITDPQSLRLIQECLSLEEKIGCHGVTDIVLDNNGDSGCIWGQGTDSRGRLGRMSS